jgi:hypothetical protein
MLLLRVKGQKHFVWDPSLRPHFNKRTFLLPFFAKCECNSGFKGQLLLAWRGFRREAWWNIVKQIVFDVDDKFQATSVAGCALRLSMRSEPILRRELQMCSSSNEYRTLEAFSSKLIVYWYYPCYWLS